MYYNYVTHDWCGLCYMYYQMDNEAEKQVCEVDSLLLWLNRRKIHDRPSKAT